MTLDEALDQLNRMKKDGVPGDTKISGGITLGFNYFEFDLDFFDDTDYDVDNQGISVSTKNIKQV